MKKSPKFAEINKQKSPKPKNQKAQTKENQKSTKE